MESRKTNVTVDKKTHLAETSANVAHVLTGLQEMLENGLPVNDGDRVAAIHSATIIACDLLAKLPTDSSSGYHKAKTYLFASEEELVEVAADLLHFAVNEAPAPFTLDQQLDQLATSINTTPRQTNVDLLRLLLACASSVATKKAETEVGFAPIEDAVKAADRLLDEWLGDLAESAGSARI